MIEIVWQDCTDMYIIMHIKPPGGLGGAAGVEGQRDGKFREGNACRASVGACNVHVHVLVGVNVSVIMCILVWIHVHVCVALPIVVGALPMAGTLWLLFEYYYYAHQTENGSRNGEPS